MSGVSVRKYFFFSWIVLLVLAVFSGIGMSLGLSFLDYRSAILQDEKAAKLSAEEIGRRVSSEILLKSSGRLESVIENLKLTYNAPDIIVSMGDANLKSEIGYVRSAVPGVPVPYNLWVGYHVRHYLDFVRLRHFVLALVPALGLAILGIFFQQHLIKRRIIGPIEALAETTEGTRGIHPEWPKEIQRIALTLSESFSNREQAVFGQLARGIIHDLKTYTSSMALTTELIQSTTDPVQRASRLEKLFQACKVNLPKIGNVIDLSLDSARGTPVNPKPCEISELIKSSSASLKMLADSRNVEVELEMTPSIGICDPVRMEQVFSNLLKNAIEAAQTNDSNPGRVRVSISEIDSRIVRVSFEDNGPGLAKGTQVARMLKTTKKHGHGLGLYFAKSIIEQHSSTLNMGKSQALGGALFSVDLSKAAKES